MSQSKKREPFTEPKDPKHWENNTEAERKALRLLRAFAYGEGSEKDIEAILSAACDIKYE